MEVRLTRVANLTVIALLLLALACQDITADQTTIENTVIRDLAAPYQVTTDWWGEEFIFTLQAQERMVTGKPIVFRGSVDDVFQRNGSTYVRFSSSYLIRTDYIFELECSRSILNTVLTQAAEDNRRFREYAVVAKIVAVSKPIISLEPSALYLGPDDIGALVIDIRPSNNFFIARGTCLDLAEIPTPGP